MLERAIGTGSLKWPLAVRAIAVRSGVYQLEVQASFSAAHAIVIGGVREPLHGHDWHVTVVVAGESLDGEGLLVDFHWLVERVREVIGPFQNQNLNAVEPFAGGVNPTAEHVARHIGQSLSDRLATWSGNASKDHRSPVFVRRVRVTEAVGCAAVFEPRR